mgnify:CR=1 FL=1
MNRPVQFTLKEFPSFLRDCLDKHSGLAVIIDPVRWENLETDLLRTSRQWTLLYRGPEVKEYRNVMPHAVFMQEEDGFYPQLVRKIGQECCIIAEIDVPPTDFSKFVKFLMELPYCVTPEGKNGFFRYYDPSILAAFLSCADKEQLSRLFGPYISAFWYEDGYAGTVSCRVRPDDLPEPSSSPFRIGPEQFEILLEAQHEKYVQAVEREIRREFYPSERFPSSGLNRHIRAALETAEQYSCISRTEGYEFVRASARHGWSFHEQAGFQKLLTDAGLSTLEKLAVLNSSERAPS